MDDDRRPFDCSIETLKRINQLLIDMQECRVHFKLLAYKGNIYELYKEAMPFLCDHHLHETVDLDSENQEMIKHKTSCRLCVAAKKWAEIERHEIETDGQGRITCYYDETVTAMDTFDFWLRLILHKEGLTYRGKSNPGRSIFRGTS